jgi:hypothetical protein
MRLPRVWLSILAVSGLLLAGEKPPVAAADPNLRTEKTQTIEFASGGLLRVVNSAGALTIEAWDKPTVELTTVKSSALAVAPKDREKVSAKFERVAVTADRHGNELTITTTAPRLLMNLELSSHLWVPRDTHVVIHQKDGEVNVEGLTGDIEASVRNGEIFVYLPEGAAAYNTKAKSRFGGIVMPGDPSTHHVDLGLGHSFVQEAGPKAHTLNLKVGYGDIYIMKPTAPKSQPAAATP